MRAIGQKLWANAVELVQCRQRCRRVFSDGREVRQIFSGLLSRHGGRNRNVAWESLFDDVCDSLAKKGCELPGAGNYIRVVVARRAVASLTLVDGARRGPSEQEHTFAA